MEFLPVQIERKRFVVHYEDGVIPKIFLYRHRVENIRNVVDKVYRCSVFEHAQDRHTIAVIFIVAGIDDLQLAADLNDLKPQADRSLRIIERGYETKIPIAVELGSKITGCIFWREENGADASVVTGYLVAGIALEGVIGCLHVGRRAHIGDLNDYRGRCLGVFIFGLDRQVKLRDLFKIDLGRILYADRPGGVDGKDLLWVSPYDGEFHITG